MESARLACTRCRAGVVVTAVPNGQRLSLITIRLRKEVTVTVSWRLGHGLRALRLQAVFDQIEREMEVLQDRFRDKLDGR